MSGRIRTQTQTQCRRCQVTYPLPASPPQCSAQTCHHRRGVRIRGRRFIVFFDTLPGMRIDERGNLAGPRPIPRRARRRIPAGEYFKGLSNCRAVMGITAARAYWRILRVDERACAGLQRRRKGRSSCSAWLPSRRLVNPLREVRRYGALC